MISAPNFTSKDFLLNHVRETLAFYTPRVLDETGGFIQHFLDDGSICNVKTRHLVSSARFVFNYAMAEQYFPDKDYTNWVRHGLRYLEDVHFQPETGGYAWLIEAGEVADATNHCYGLAFVMVAASTAMLAGVEEGHVTLDKAWALMEHYFWDEEYGLYRDEANADFSVVDTYRGQNANMHSCEALLWAFEATGESGFLQRAGQLADNITRRQADKANGLIWEHYNPQWEVDWDYNLDDPKNLLRPWGFQAGHQAEWTKLLLILNRHAPQDWYVPRARALFDQALEKAWDHENGGICYGFAPGGSICDGDKYFWVQAESFAAAALLAEATGEQAYRDWYEKIWAYSWEHMVDHQYGAWFRVLTQDNKKYDDLKSPAVKTDYHTMGACYEVLRGALSLLT